MRVLFVDDSITTRQSIRNMVEVLNVDCLEAGNGIEALEVLDQYKGKVDLILLDWEMPEMDGRQFLGIIKKDPRYRSIPVIMLTTINQKEKMIDAIRAGAKQYLTKPFSGEDLLTRIVQTLGVDRLDKLKP